MAIESCFQDSFVLQCFLLVLIFCCWQTSHCHISLHLLISWWTFRLFPLGGCNESCWDKYSCTVVCTAHILVLLNIYLRVNYCLDGNPEFSSLWKHKTALKLTPAAWAVYEGFSFSISLISLPFVSFYCHLGEIGSINFIGTYSVVMMLSISWCLYW